MTLRAPSVTRALRVVLVASCLLLAAGGRAFAQITGTDPSTTPMIQSLTSAPTPGKGSVSLTGGASFTSTSSQTLGWQVSSVADYTTAQRWLMRLDYVSNYASYGAAPGAARVKISDNHFVSGTFLHRIRTGVSLIAIAGWRRDTIMQLNRRVWGEGGIGFHLVEGKKINMVVAPTFALGREHRAFTSHGDGVEDFGVLQMFTYVVPGTVGIQESLHTGIDSSATDDRSTSFNVSVSAKVAPHVGMKVYYQLQYDSLPPPGTPQKQYTVGFGVSVSFAHPAK
jgi:hypothetical protein